MVNDKCFLSIGFMMKITAHFL